MADNILVKDGNAATVTVISKDTGAGIQLPGHHIADPTTPSQKLAVSAAGAASANLAQVAGTTTDVNSGNKSAGTQRVIIATDQPALTNALLVTAAGDTASAATDGGNPIKIGFPGRTADQTAVTNGQRTNSLSTILGKQIVKLDSIPDNTWNYAAAAGGLVSNTGVTAKTAAGAGIRNYVKSAQVMNSHATISSEVVINDGAAGTTLWRGWAQAAGGGISVVFDPPLRGTANTLIEIKEITSTSSTGILVSLQGYIAAE